MLSLNCIPADLEMTEMLFDPLVHQLITKTSYLDHCLQLLPDVELFH